MKRLVGKAAQRLENLSVIDPISRCHFFIGCLHKDGYGLFAFGGKTRLAHRASWLIHRGPIPDGLHVMHGCDNPQCVNVDHLSLGTRSDNMQDMYAKGRYPIKRSARKRAKLDQSKAFEIRWYDAIGTRHKDIAAMYGVTRPLVSAICRNEVWQQECHD